MTPPLVDQITTFHLELKAGADPYRRRGIHREPMYRLKRLLKYAARECGFRIGWAERLPSPPEQQSQGNICFRGGPAAGQSLLVHRDPLYLRVIYDCVKQTWGALDQLTASPAAGEAVFVYRRDGARGARFTSATYTWVVEQPDDATTQDTTAWRLWCVEQQARASREVRN